jgi:SRSO17 transposase
VTKDLTFQTKPQLALALLQPLWDSGLFPGNWITCDASFGNNADFLAQLPPQSLYLATIACTHKVWVKAVPGHADWETDGCAVERLAEAKGFLSWQNHKVAEGEKGPLVAAFARLRVYVQADCKAESERWLLVRNDANGKIKYALSNAPEATPLTELVRVSAARWPIERCFEEDKSELGMDHYEHRSWPAWHRHMRLAFLAQLFLLRLQRKYKKSPGTDVAPGPAVIGMEFAPSAGGSGLHVGDCLLSSTTKLSIL